MYLSLKFHTQILKVQTIMNTPTEDTPVFPVRALCELNVHFPVIKCRRGCKHFQGTEALDTRDLHGTELFPQFGICVCPCAECQRVGWCHKIVCGIHEQKWNEMLKIPVPFTITTPMAIFEKCPIVLCVLVGWCWGKLKLRLQSYVWTHLTALAVSCQEK